MSENTKRWCVLIPLSSTETWAVPQNCLGEIMTVFTDAQSPPAEVSWRDHQVPVLDPGADGGMPWREPGRGAGLIAIFLGLKGEGCEYWGVAIRGDGLRAVGVSAAEVEDAQGAVRPNATAAFRFQGVLCQVPDLDHFQREAACSLKVA